VTPARNVGDPLLVVVAHPDDEALGFAGVIARARAEGRKVRVAVVTNGADHSLRRLQPRFRGARLGWPVRIAGLGVRRGRETIAAMALLGLRFTRNPRTSDVFLLGYPNYGLETIAGFDELLVNESPSPHQTYATGGSSPIANGDLGYLMRGRHSKLCARDLAQDVDDLLDLAEPSDVYTHAEFDGHSDHAEVHRQVVAALRRRGQPVMLHSTLIHPAGTRENMYESAYEWPNPSQDEVATPYERFTPHLDFRAPPADSGLSWGPLGPPNEIVDVPYVMQHPNPERNLKWQTIARYVSQLDCSERGDGSYHPSCGYLRAFAKRVEFFWTLSIAF
jgi:LmbE family N-acetylglucosaminyl deacetylase